MNTPINPIEGPFGEIPAKKPGTIVVAVGAKGSIEIRVGDRLTWGERVFGGYKAFYLVDVSIKSITENYQVSSSQTALSLIATVTFDIRVRDARAIVERGITNLSTLLFTPTRRILFEIGKRYNVTNIAGAHQAMQQALDDMEIDPAIELTHVSIDLKPDDAAQSLLRQIHEEELKTAAIGAQSRVEAVARGGMRDILQSTDDLLAQLLVTKDDSFRTALQIKMDQAATEQERRMVIMKALIDSKIIEAHDFHERFPDFVNEVFRAIPGRVTSTQPSLSDKSGPSLPAPERGKT